MQTFLIVIKIFLIIAVPVGVTPLLYYLFYKNPKLSKINNLYKNIIIGIVFSLMTISAFYFGFIYKDIDNVEISSTFSNVNSIPVVCTFVFGWFPGLISGLLGSLYRIFIQGFSGSDLLKWGEVASLVFSTGIAILIRELFFKNNRPQWYKAFVTAFLIENVHALLIYLISLVHDRDTYFGFLIISQCDYVCLILSLFTISLSLLLVQIVNKDNLKINFKENRFSTKVRASLFTCFLISIVASSVLIAYSKVRISRGNLDNNMNQSIEGISDSICLNIYENENRDDYSSMVDKNPLLAYCQNNYFQENGTLMIVDAKNQLVASCNKFFIKSGNFINTRFYVLDAKDKRKRYFSDKDFYKENEIFEAYFTIKYGLKSTDIKYLMKYQHLQENQQRNNLSEEKWVVDYYIVSLIPYTNIYYPVATDSRLTIYIISLIFVLIYYVIYYFVEKKVIHSIDSINNSLVKITSGDLNIKVESMKDYEFKILSNGINTTVDSLKKFIEEANKRIDTELEYAKKIQQNSLPIIFPTTNTYDLYASMHTAKQVGGDFYDFFPIDNDHLFFLIADVSGKGIPAAMFMMRSKTLVKSLAQTNELTLDHIISGVNDELNQDNKAGMFVTAWFGLLNTTNGELDFVNAGHNAPLIRKNKKYSYLTMLKNCVLGVLPYIQYKMEHIKLEPDESIILYTDGVTEATSKEKELYGEERLLELVNSIDYSSSSQTLDAIYNEVDKFQTGAEQADDITLFMITYKGNK